MSDRTGLPDVRRWWWLAALVVLALAVPAYLLASAGPALTDDQERARDAAAELPELEVGEVAPLAEDARVEGPGIAAEVATPGGSVGVGATEPGPAGGGHRAGDDARVVAVRWEVLYRYDPTVAADTAEADVPELTVAVRRGDEAVDLAGAGDTAVPGIDLDAGDLPRGGIVMAIAPDEDDLVLTVTFDGVDQTVDLLTGEIDAGRAAGLYDADRSRYVPERCDLLRAAPDYVELEGWCAVGEVVLSSWTAQTGWVDEAGDRWAVVRTTAYVDVYATSSGPSGTEDLFLDRVEPSLRLTLDGADPVGGPASPGGLTYVGTDAGPSEAAVFAVPAGEDAGELRIAGEIAVADREGEQEPIVIAVDETLEVRGG